MNKNATNPNYSAFTVSELGIMLPDEYTSQRCNRKLTKHKWLCNVWDYNGMEDAIYGETEADARANRLIYLLENKLIKVEDLK